MQKNKNIVFIAFILLAGLIFNSCEKTGNKTDGFRIDENQKNWTKYIYSERSKITGTINYGAYEVIGFNQYNNKLTVFFNRYLTNTQGCIASSTNGGTIWTVDLIQNMEYVFVDFVNDSMGFALTKSITGEKILHSTDGGTSWQSSNLVFPGDFPYAVDFVSDNIAYGLNSSGMYRSINAGQNWDKLHNSIYDNIFFLNDSLGFVFSSNSLYKTSDSAKTWNSLYNAPSAITTVYAKNENELFLGLKQGFIQKSTDGGVSFQSVSDYIPSLDNSEEAVVTEIAFFDNNIAFAAIRSDQAIDFPNDEIGIGVILKTDDGGDTWYLNYRTQMIKFNGFYLIDNTTNFAYGRQESDHVFRQAYILKTTTLGS